MSGTEMQVLSVHQVIAGSVQPQASMAVHTLQMRNWRQREDCPLAQGHNPRSHSREHRVRQRLNQADNQQHPGSLSSEKAGYGCLLGCSLRDAVVSRRLSPISLWLLVRVTPHLSICNCSSRNPGVHKEGFWEMCWVLTCYNPGIIFSRKFSPNLWPVYFSLALCFYMKGWLTLPLDCTKDS